MTAFEVRAQTPSPDVLVRNTTEEVLSIVRNDKDIKAGKVDRIVNLIEEKVAPHFDFARMTRLAVGRAWRDATPAQREALIKEFRSLLVRSYSAAFTAYTGVSVEYRPFRFNPGDTEATVQTLIKLPGGAEPVSVDYDMALTPAGWKVYDLRVAGASLIINYRNLFALEIDRGGIDGLIKSLINRNSASANTAPADKQ
ncbi:MAG: MlaC/ttg2D family ABC transporter substrate-binding protein [Burkholderiales bacterium]